MKQVHAFCSNMQKLLYEESRGLFLRLFCTFQLCTHISDVILLTSCTNCVDWKTHSGWGAGRDSGHPSELQWTKEETFEHLVYPLGEESKGSSWIRPWTLSLVCDVIAWL